MQAFALTNGITSRAPVGHDGYRMQAHLVEGKPALLTSSGLDWTGGFKELPANSIIIDGEVVVPDRKGIADFSELQAELAAGHSARMLYYAFDLLFLDGFDLRACAADRAAQGPRRAAAREDRKSHRLQRAAPWAWRVWCASCATVPIAQAEARHG